MPIPATYGSHAAVRVDNSGSPLLYDPNGGYRRNNESGSSEIFIGPDADLGPYSKYHLDDGSKVIIYNFNTTPEQEAEIAANMKKFNSIGGRPYYPYCSTYTSMVLDGIGPFENLGIHQLPGYLEDALQSIQAKRCP